MEDLVDSLTLGNPSAVKAVLASVATALAVYQVVLIAIAYGKVRRRALSAPVASFTHRASGDAILVLVVVVALFCLARFHLDDDGAVHAISGAALFVALGLKLAVLHRWHRLGRFLPLLGTTVFVLLAITWLTSAGHSLAEGE
jgi:L-asparagine transporter-like permease